MHPFLVNRGTILIPLKRVQNLRVERPWFKILQGWTLCLLHAMITLISSVGP